MKRFIEGENRSQSTLFPESLDDYIAEDNAVRVVDPPSPLRFLTMAWRYRPSPEPSLSATMARALAGRVLFHLMVTR